MCVNYFKKFITIFLILLFAACDICNEQSYEQVAMDYLKKRGYFDLIRSNDIIPEMQFVTQRRRYSFNEHPDSIGLDHSEFYECAQNQLCYNTFIDENRVKALYFYAGIKRNDKSKRTFIGVFIDTVFLNPIGIIHGSPQGVLSISKFDNSVYSTRREISDAERMVFNDSLRKEKKLKVKETKNVLLNHLDIRGDEIYSNCDLNQIFFKDEIHHIAILSIVQDFFFPDVKVQDEFIDFENENDSIRLLFNKGNICLMSNKISRCD